MSGDQAEPDRPIELRPLPERITLRTPRARVARVFHLGRVGAGVGEVEAEAITARCRIERGEYAAAHLPVAELSAAAFPLLPTTGRVLYDWHGGD
jgi:hypothetical protein